MSSFCVKQFFLNALRSSNAGIRRRKQFRGGKLPVWTFSSSRSQDDLFAGSPHAMPQKGSLIGRSKFYGQGSLYNLGTKLIDTKLYNIE